jgi:hypothetical protein
VTLHEDKDDRRSRKVVVEVRKRLVVKDVRRVKVVKGESRNRVCATLDSLLSCSAQNLKIPPIDAREKLNVPRSKSMPMMLFESSAVTFLKYR